MPQFEIRQRRVGPENTVPAQQMGFEGVQQAVQSGQQALETVDHIANAWQEAEDLAQLTTATNNLASQQMGFESELANVNISAGEDGDFYKVLNEKKQYFQNKLSSIRANGSQITSTGAKAQYTQIADMAEMSAKVKLDTVFRQKLVDHQKVELVRSGDLMKQSYLSGNKEAKQAYSDQLQSNLAKGFIDEGEKYKYDQSLEDWDISRAIHIADADPTLALEMIESGDLSFDSPEDKKNAEGQVRQMQGLKKSQEQMAILNEQDDNSSKFGENYGQLTVGQQLSELKSGSDLGDYDKDWAKSMEARILSSKGITPETRQDVMSGFVQRQGSLAYGVRKSGGMSGQDYLRGSKKLKVDINKAIAKGDISADKGDKLINSLEKTKSAGLSKLDLSKSWGYQFNDGVDYLSKELSGEPLYSAVIDYFYATDAEEKPDYKQMAKQAVSDYTNKVLTGGVSKRDTVIAELKKAGYATTEDNIKFGLAQLGE